MSLTLYYHPLSSFCWKALVALYENETPFTPQLTNLGDDASRAALVKLWPIAKFPVLHDEERAKVVPESTIIIEYLAQHYPGNVDLVAKDGDLARGVRERDRFFDLYLHVPMQKIVGDKLRPKGKNDPFGVEQAHTTIETAYGIFEAQAASAKWAFGDSFTMADCAAAPALYYANKVKPLGAKYPNITAYLARLTDRPSFARVLKEAEPYFAMFPA